MMMRVATYRYRHVTVESSKKRAEGRVARFVRRSRGVIEDPWSIMPLMRKRFVSLWKTKGGGFYGLGYVLTFIILEIRTLAGDIGSSGSVSEFVTAQLVQYVIRISFESLINAFLALLWPLYLWSQLEIWGLVVLGMAYLGFVLVLRPSLAIWFPELGQTETEGQPRDGEGK